MNCNQSLIILFLFDSSRFSGQTPRIYKACPGATSRITFLVLNEYGIFSVILSPCKPGLGQGHTKKRHLHVPCKKKTSPCSSALSFLGEAETLISLFFHLLFTILDIGVAKCHVWVDCCILQGLVIPDPKRGVVYNLVCPNPQVCFGGVHI